MAFVKPPQALDFHEASEKALVATVQCDFWTAIEHYSKGA
jgi:hypothetical protein